MPVLLHAGCSARMTHVRLGRRSRGAFFVQDSLTLCIRLLISELFLRGHCVSGKSEAGSKGYGQEHHKKLDLTRHADFLPLVYRFEVQSLAVQSNACTSKISSFSTLSSS